MPLAELGAVRSPFKQRAVGRKKLPGRDVLVLLIVVGSGAYGFYGSMTETGLGGWLNHAQQAIFGSYLVKASVILSVAVVSLLGLLAEFAWNRVSGSPKASGQGIAHRILFGPMATAPMPPSAQTPVNDLTMQGKILLKTTIILVAATWVIGFAIYWGYAMERREDATAPYHPINLSDGMPRQALPGSHIALRGAVPIDVVLVHWTGSDSSKREDYQLAPLASRSWHKGQPVNFVVKTTDPTTLQVLAAKPAARRDQAAPGVLMARVEGPVPGPVAQEFKKVGVALGEPSYLLRPVPTRDGKVITESIEEAFIFFLALCGIVSAIICASTGGAWLVMRTKAGANKSSR